MKKTLIVTKEERSKMDDVDQKQQDAIETVASRMDSLVWAILIVNLIWAGALIFVFAFK